MKRKGMLRALCLFVLSVQVWAQAPSTADNQPANATAAQAGSAEDLKQLKDRIALQEEAIRKLQDSLNQQRALLDQAIKTQEEQKQPVTAAANAPATSADIVPVANIIKPVSARTAQKSDTAPAPSPLSFSIGNSTFTPLGFVDLTYFWRSSNVGSGIGTNFAGIPFNNVIPGNLSETNLSAQNSRVGVRIDSKLMGWNVLGYLETDFLFNNNANSYQIGSNSAGLRLRNYFVDVAKDKFEFMGGQDWSMLTPNRKGLSPIPGDIFYTQNMDTNYQIGLVWTRAPQVRFIYHPNKSIAWGLALENPQQYIGGGMGSGAATLPTNVSGIAGEFQANTNALNVPNLIPDIISKLAFDCTPHGRAMHFEVAGFLRGFKDYIPHGTVAANAGKHTVFGGGGEVNSNLELFKNVRLVENLYFSDGGGRYVFGSAPDLVVRSTGDLSLVHAHSTVDGIEAQVTPKTFLAAYYGGLYVGRNVVLNTNGTPAGYGYSGAAGSQNRYIQELTFDWVQTLWKNKNYGALALINQYSYVFREPWSVVAPAPKAAHDNMVFIDVRYTLP